MVNTIDLRLALPYLLDSAIKWAESKAGEVQTKGRLLGHTDLRIAMKVGVRRPDLIRTLIVDKLPLPDHPRLRDVALQTGLLGPAMIGLTLGYSILVVRGNFDSRLLAHECRHVHQYETYGSIAQFLPVYLEQIASVGYYKAPFEQDAREHEL
jgi:hypothetical protein